MAMKELMRVELDAKTIRKACEAWVRSMTKGPDAEYAANGVTEDWRVVVVVSKKRAARKAKGDGNGAVASAGPLSDQEQRFA